MEPDIKDRAGVIAPPPLIFALFLLAASVLHLVFPLHIPGFAFGTRLVIAISPLAVSAILAVLSYLAMRESNTPVNPNKPTRAIVAKGPYRHTRNPLYVSLLLLYGGTGVLANTLWAILLLPALLAVFHYGVVRREEEYLEKKFGGEYLRYKNAVRRWI